ncbi:hypothetical protein [Pseudotabrizicola algicola]|uniref:DUF115 domain-containing protein n=1 Tax=Pseudotabrizicola algicola TaxID=2709381 RepID=A0A6B3RX52_9RHOB|nr:hypothetical protein [Pseudotabrizicola algicola]NEX47659.1 hypothetical protein [Pseudotabrizicola algicola]
MRTVIIMGSGPGVLASKAWAKDGATLVAINNAWQVRPDWDVLIHPDDFPVDRRPVQLGTGQRIVTSAEYVPLQNDFGGFVYAGGTMAFTAAYWALAALRPQVIGFIGCDMVYPARGNTHFYGTGTADPLRPDISLRSLEAKSARFMALAAREGCAVVNLSDAADSRLVFPRAARADLSRQRPQMPSPHLHAVLQREAELGYMVPSGKYWKEAHRFDPAQIDRLDAMWLEVCAVRSSLPA